MIFEQLSVFSRLFHLQTKRLLKQLAYVRLGLTSKQFDELREQCSTEEQFISTLDERAVDQDVPLHVREEISSLQYQLKAAMTAHNSWQPPKVFVCFY